MRGSESYKLAASGLAGATTPGYIRTTYGGNMTKPLNQSQQWVSPIEFATHYRISPKTVYGLLHAGKLHGVRFGKAWRLPLGQDAYQGSA